MPRARRRERRHERMLALRRGARQQRWAPRRLGLASSRLPRRWRWCRATLSTIPPSPFLARKGVIKPNTGDTPVPRQRGFAPLHSPFRCVKRAIEAGPLAGRGETLIRGQPVPRQRGFAPFDRLRAGSLHSPSRERQGYRGSPPSKGVALVDGYVVLRRRYPKWVQGRALVLESGRSLWRLGPSCCPSA